VQSTKPRLRRKKPKTESRKGSDTSDDNLSPTPNDEETTAIANASDSDEPEIIRTNNAYTGATNSIGSVHQRHWFMALDRINSGFLRATSGDSKGNWISSGPGRGFETFYVQGAEIERSIITGRISDEVMRDEGVEGFKGRGGWRAVLE
jgi:hypothetical protein